MKYIDADRLRAEIERRLSLLEGGTSHPEVVKRVEGVIKGYNSILSLIDSLQHEQTEVDIEKEIDLFVNGWNIDEFLGLVNDEGWSVTVGDIKNVARHFYELGRLNARKEK